MLSPSALILCPNPPSIFPYFCLYSIFMIFSRNIETIISDICTMPTTNTLIESSMYEILARISLLFIDSLSSFKK